MQCMMANLALHYGIALTLQEFASGYAGYCCCYKGQIARNAVLKNIVIAFHFSLRGIFVVCRLHDSAESVQFKINPPAPNLNPQNASLNFFFNAVSAN